RRAILEGLPGTGMPGFEAVLSRNDVTNLVYYLKSLAPDFQDPNAYAEPVPVPSPPPFSEDSLDVGFQAYVEIGCARCHGEQGRGDGRSAATMRDDWGDFVPPADLTMPWRFRGGGSREDIFRSISTGLYGTPMAGFADGLSEEERWQIVDWIVAQARDLGATGDPGQAPYDSLVRAVPAAGTLDAISGNGDLAAARELFEDAPKALFPVVGQVIEPGRSFQPGTAAVGVQAIYDSLDVAFLVTWHNITAETSGHNGPDLQVERQDGVAFPGLREDGEGEADEAEAEDDVWGTGGGQGGDPFGQTTTAAPGPPPGSDEFSDAIALQLPVELREGAEKPYFLWGDTNYPVELWFVDLASPEATVFEGRGLGTVTPTDTRPPEVLAGYEDGEWAVVFKRPRNPARGVAFDEETFVPIAFSVWDGFYRERGPRRGVTRWFHAYVEPAEQPSVLAPMAKAGLTILALELLVVGWVRRRHGK
ncbi:MAG: c-type cytochrome, partial [Acidobacteriota bacterium]